MGMKKLGGFFLKAIFVFFIFILSNQPVLTGAATAVQNVVLEASSPYIEEGDTFTVTAKFLPAKVKDKNLIWKVKSKYLISPLKQISKNKFQAVELGNVTIVASEKKSKKTYKLKLTIHKKLGDFYVTINGHKVSEANLNVGDYAIASAKYNKELDTSFSWSMPSIQPIFSIENPSIASVNQQGQIIALATGSTKLCITAQNQKSVTLPLIVSEKTEEVSLSMFYADKISDYEKKGNYSLSDERSGIENTYFFEKGDGNLEAFIQKYVGNGSQTLSRYTYDKNFSFLEQKTIVLPYNYFGSLYQAADGNYYVVIGQNNEEQNNAKIVFSVLKLDSGMNQIGRCDIYGSDSSTSIPFQSGGCSIDLQGNTLVVHTSRERYTSEDGLNHQSNITFFIDTVTMTKNYVGSLFPYNHVSHSFQQKVKFDQGNLIYVDHGDAYPRSIVMQTHRSFSPYGLSDSYSSRPSLTIRDLIRIKGETGENYTGTKVNGFELGQYYNIVTGVSIHHEMLDSSSFKNAHTQNLYVVLADKIGNNSSFKWLTNYPEGDVTVNNSRLVKINENQFAVLYQIINNKSYKNTTGFLLMDSNGTIMKQKIFDIGISNMMQPISFQGGILLLNENLISSNIEGMPSNLFYFIK